MSVTRSAGSTHTRQSPIVRERDGTRTKRPTETSSFPEEDGPYRLHCLLKSPCVEGLLPGRDADELGDHRVCKPVRRSVVGRPIYQGSYSLFRGSLVSQKGQRLTTMEDGDRDCRGVIPTGEKDPSALGIVPAITVFHLDPL